MGFHASPLVIALRLSSLICYKVECIMRNFMFRMLFFAAVLCFFSFAAHAREKINSFEQTGRNVDNVITRMIDKISYSAACSRIHFDTIRQILADKAASTEKNVKEKASSAAGSISKKASELSSEAKNKADSVKDSAGKVYNETSGKVFDSVKPPGAPKQ